MWKWSELKRIIMRKAADDYSRSAIVTWPVEYPNPQEQVGGSVYIPPDPHVTILYIHDIDSPDLGFTKEDMMDAIKETRWEVMLLLKVDKLEWFGPDNDIPVLRVEHSHLHPYRKALKEALAKRGIVIEETFPEYKPHVTIPETAAVVGIWPTQFLAGPVELWWGGIHHKIT